MTKPISRLPIRLLITDMDSTLIGQETIDEIADWLGLKGQVSEITEMAMAGDLDFEQALRRRVRLLEGLPEQHLREVYDTRLRVNPGVVETLAYVSEKGMKTAVVSGGFQHFTQWISADLGIDYERANQFQVHNGKLTGELQGDIINAVAKRSYLLDLCQQLAITPEQVIALGDGANDLLMLQTAGIGVAYHAKQIVQQHCQHHINHGGWEQLKRWV